MTNPVTQLFNFTEEREFKTRMSLSDAAAHLSKIITKTPLQATLTNELSEAALVGNVSQEEVKLHKVRYMRGNIFKPIFSGKFQLENGRAVLIGRFKMALLGKVATTSFLIICIFAQLISVTAFDEKNGMQNISLFAPAIFAFIGILITLSGKLSGQEDVEWIQKRIERALL